VRAERRGALAHPEGARIGVRGHPGRGQTGARAWVELDVMGPGRAPLRLRFARDDARALCARIFAELGRAEERVR